MTTLNLKEKFQQAASLLKDSKGSEEVTTLIHRTPWVRILLESDQQEDDSFTIEIEMSIPNSVGTEGSDSSELINELTEHLQYLQKLRDSGFELSVIGGGCIYCASKEIHEPPEDNLFRVLIPP